MPSRQIESFSDLPVSDRKAHRLGMGIVGVTFGLFGTWAALAPLDGAAYAPGVVTVQTYRKTVQHLEGGIVKSVLAHDGDIVKRDDPLIILDDAQLRSEYEATQSLLIAARAMESRLIAERDGLPAIDFGPMSDPASVRGEEARQGETQVFNARRGSRLGQIAVLRERIGQLHQQIKGLESMIAVKVRLEKSYSGEIGELSDLLKQGFVDKQRLLEQDRKLGMLRSEVADHRSTIDKTRLQINETQLQILQVDKDFDSDVAKQLAEVQTKIYDLQEKNSALEDRLSRIVIRAPDAGMVIGMTVHTIGGVVRSATPLLDIVPSVSELVIEAQVAPVDIDRIAIGKRADIRFGAFNSSTTPVIEGEVSSVSGDRLTNEKTGTAYYLARVRVTEHGVRTLGERKLLPGMPADVLIVTGQRTLLQYLMQPARDVMSQSMIEE
ncbi:MULTISPECIES: HlyD family type I secretion periplasmic adaptor subunit [Pseudomonas]|jgi:type I secretion membrane fusion protein, HlyD family|uniref:HlyD family type I secretion periplasmic adaptor subunit n=1 Tax=Pseudomonas TaxID=286 RepID=UPI00026E482D|nr:MULTISPECIES: HlyD family type I secretion periplasmic adaptor subunit [Pseudomonas]EJL06624.1 type I secretion membrane fusion protein, HlyD family [Pseudomonas chlororaphis subsp. aureofaciens 30-84]MCP1478308.1 epimerase transport system membrane fusion protein [Pseudomonas chlororaphis]MCP1595340.1 epimerase transport system membrane fusion protein [Pseudomonas chlororaphis]ROL80273.1 hemolysin secretion protein D [Pseudomonas chlororaphis]ROL89647.1 hemolysin secretion protein D [Pseud